MKAFAISLAVVSLISGASAAGGIVHLSKIDLNSGLGATLLGGAGCQWYQGKTIIAATDYGSFVIGVDGAPAKTSFPGGANVPNLGANDFAIQLNNMSFHFVKMRTAKPMSGESEVEKLAYRLTIARLGKSFQTVRLTAMCGA